jgi:hypothetical protein
MRHLFILSAFIYFMYVPILGKRDSSPVIRWTFRKIDDGSFDGRRSYNKGASGEMNVPLAVSVANPLGERLLP